MAAILLPVGPPTAIQVTLVGWGATRMGAAPPNQMQRIEKFLWTQNAQCQTALGGSHDWFDEDKICTLLRNGTGKYSWNYLVSCLKYLLLPGICDGDQGGPVFIGRGNTATVVGVISWNLIPCAFGFPDVHERVHPHLVWIRATTGIPAPPTGNIQTRW